MAMTRHLLAMVAGWVAIKVVSFDYVDSLILHKQVPVAYSRQQNSVSAPVSSQRALLNRYCVSCHSQTMKTAGLALDTLDITAPRERAEVWEKVVRKLRSGLMPPAGRARPDRATGEAFVSSLESELDRAPANPGRTETFHRLNRSEYRNAVRDLLGLDVDVNSFLPEDDASYGFDNIAGVLKFNQTQMERYVSAALKISRLAVGRPMPPTSETFPVSVEASVSTVCRSAREGDC
jgi:hypothetical protein